MIAGNADEASPSAEGADGARIFFHSFITDDTGDDIYGDEDWDEAPSIFFLQNRS